MTKEKMHVILSMLPVSIEEIFFSEFSFEVHPQTEELGINLSIKDLEVNTLFAILDEETKRVQVSVRYRTRKEISSAVNFSLSCTGIYEYTGNATEDDWQKNVYSWGISIQTSMIRQKLAEETSKTPYHEAFYIPLSMVKIEVH